MVANIRKVAKPTSGNTKKPRTAWSITTLTILPLWGAEIRAFIKPRENQRYNRLKILRPNIGKWIFRRLTLIKFPVGKFFEHFQTDRIISRVVMQKNETNYPTCPF